MANCTKEYALQIASQYLNREWELIKKIDFPKISEKDIEIRLLKNEIINLINKNVSQEGIDYTKNHSKIIKYFNLSLRYANRKGNDSPFDFWQKLKSDKELFFKFYQNRLRCSDWFKEKDNMKYLEQGYVPEFIYGIGLTTSMSAPFVSYFKPVYAKYLINKYLKKFSTIFDPFAGFGGRLLGTVSLNKNYIGYDLNDNVIIENKQIWEFWKDNTFTKSDVQLYCKDSLNINEIENFDCLFTCPPYSDLETWRNSKGELIKCELNCDEIIDVILQKYNCKKYVFVVDNKIQKYKQNVVEELNNFSYIKSRDKDTSKCNTKECVVVIEK